MKTNKKTMLDTIREIGDKAMAEAAKKLNKKAVVREPFTTPNQRGKVTHGQA